MDYTKPATQESIDRALAALTKNGFKPEVIESKEAVLARIKELIPAGASIANGSSRTLEEVGYIAHLKEGNHGWNNLHEAVLKEEDPEKKALLRKQSVVSDVYLGSVHALTEEGEFLVASNTGSQMPHIVFTSPEIILVVGAQKLVPTLRDAFARLKERVIPLEDERMKQVYGFGTTYSKSLVYHQENPALGRSIRILIVKESLGF